MTPIGKRRLLQMLAGAPAGPRIEFGVFHGDTLRLIARHPGITFGIDSFEGMPEPTARDMKDGKNPYPKGRLAVGIDEARLNTRECECLMLIRGFVPEVLRDVPQWRYAFAHVDMDQYDSTFAALQWLWPLMAPGGIICCDDYIAGRDWLSAGAIDAFAASVNQPLAGCEAQMAWFTRPAAA